MVFDLHKMSDDEGVILYFLLVVIGSAIGVIIGEAFLVVLRGVIRFALKCVTDRFYYRYLIRSFKDCLFLVAWWVCFFLLAVILYILVLNIVEACSHNLMSVLCTVLFQKQTSYQSDNSILPSIASTPHNWFVPTQQLLITDGAYNWSQVTPNFNADHCKICYQHNRYNTVFGHICCELESGLIQMQRKCNDLNYLEEFWSYHDCVENHVDEWILPALEQKYHALNPRNDAMLHYWFLDDLNILVRWLVWRAQSNCCYGEIVKRSVSECMDEFMPLILRELSYWLYGMAPGLGSMSP